MNKIKVVVAFVAGLVGGMISRYSYPAPVLAQQSQTQSPATVEVRAQRFVLVNPQGGVLATFAVDPPRFDPSNPNIGPLVRLLDSTGKQIWSAGGSPLHNLAVK
jgi:hypothetical protein